MPINILRNGRVLIALVMFLIFASMVGVSLDYPAQARFMPLVVGIPGIVLTLMELVRETIRALRPHSDSDDEEESDDDIPENVARILEQSTPQSAAVAVLKHDPRDATKREWILISYVTAMIAGLILFGFWIAAPVFVGVFLREREKASWRMTVGSAVAVIAVLYFVFHRALGVDLHTGFVIQWVSDILFPAE